MPLEWRQRKNVEGGEVWEEEALLPLEVAPDSSQRLVHPNGVRCSAGSRLWEYFQDALAYAEEAQHQPEYIQAAQASGRTPLEVAATDFFQPPEIICIDLSRYNGKKGEIIEVTAYDAVKVQQVGLLVLDEQRKLLEMGHARHIDGNLWRYEARKNLQVASVVVVADAVDLPGHVAERRLSKTLKRGRYH